MDEVGLRELRHDLARYVRRAGRGKPLTITDRGKPVAVLAPLPSDEGSLIERLIAEGRATRPSGDLLGVEPAPAPKGDPFAVSKALEESREDRF